MSPAGVNITGKKITEYSTQVGNQSVKHYRVSFMVNSHGPFTMDFTEAEFKPADVEMKLQQKAREIAQVGG